MSKGIVYIMRCTQGLLKIGCCETKEFPNRMKRLEDDGYKNFNGFERIFAVEVEDYQHKEKLCHRLFDKSQVKINGKGIEMFAIDDLPLVEELLLSFGGTQIYPKVTVEEPVIPANTQKDSKKTQRKPLTFADCCIPIGSTLHFVKDPNITAITVDDKNQVVYHGTTYSISRLAMRLTDQISAQGGRWFTYNGIKLTKLRPD